MSKENENKQAGHPENTENENTKKKGGPAKAAAQETPAVQQAVVAEPSPPKPPVILEEKMVTVKSKVSAQLFVSGWLTLEKDKEIQVTRDQKRNLEKAGLIYL